MRYWLTDRSPTLIRTLSEVQNFWTPISTSSSEILDGDFNVASSQRSKAKARLAQVGDFHAVKVDVQLDVS